ncbi:MAG TPA: leucyl aminopeptidase [Solirubrobacteraceae bacterium]|nr:leucyl aminopeptidase [Solirubrobacteraceae bacterium]
MRVTPTTDVPGETAADTLVMGVFDGESVDHPGLQQLLDAGEAKRAAGALALTHDGSRRWLLAGLGKRSDFTPELARVSAAKAAKRAGELGAKALCWQLPDGTGGEVAAALVEGTILAGYRFDRYKQAPRDESERVAPLEELIVSSPGDVAADLARAEIVAEAVNAARTLQDTPANDMTPTDLAERSLALAAELDSVSVVVTGRAEIEARGMGAFAAVAQGTYQEPALITLRYEGPAAGGPTLGFIGKAVTFDSGGISIKPGEAMDEMKYDMSGGASVIEAIGAIARLSLPVRVIGVVGATENLPSGRSMKPGDIVRTLAGVSVEINNTDAEGRLVLSDCIAYAIAEGAERLVDLATLTGACVVALGHTHAGLFSNDEAWCAAVKDAGDRTGELLWRLPLHAEYEKLVKGTFADINNAPSGRLAGASTAAEFLHRFAGETPWAHLDIAGTAWNLGREYAEKGGSGFGVRLLVELAASTPA